MFSKKGSQLLIIGVGLLLVLLGILALKGSLPVFTVFPVLPYILVGLGAGLFGTGFGSLVRREIVQRDPALARRERIEAGDERNQSLLAQAKAKAYDVFIYAFGAILLALAIVPDMNLAVLLALVLVYVMVVGMMLFTFARLQRES